MNIHYEGTMLGGEKGSTGSADTACQAGRREVAALEDMSWSYLLSVTAFSPVPSTHVVVHSPDSMHE